VDSRVSEISRRLRSRADAINGALWFMPEAQEGYPSLGIAAGSASLAGRAACLGRVPGKVAAALFVPINPARVAAAVDEAWRATDPATLLAERRQAVQRYLGEVLGGALGTPIAGLDRAVHVLRRVFPELPIEGHPVFAGLMALDWPGQLLGDLAYACEAIRERRGDSHRNAWNAAGLDPVEINVLTEPWRGVEIGSVTTVAMGWSADACAAAAERLRERGLLAGDQLTEEGQRLRDEIELATDRQEGPLVAAVGDDVDELFDLLAGWARAVVAAAAGNWRPPSRPAPPT